VIQGSGLGPTTYLVTTSDLQPVCDINHIVKFADNTYLIVPAVMDHVMQKLHISMTGLREITYC